MNQSNISHLKKQLSKNRTFTRRDFLSTSLKASAAALTTGLIPKRQVNAEGPYNVLFIAVDDLRPMLGFMDTQRCILLT